MLKHPSEEKRFFNVQLRDDDGEFEGRSCCCMDELRRVLWIIFFSVEGVCTMHTFSVKPHNITLCLKNTLSDHIVWEKKGDFSLLQEGRLFSVDDENSTMA